MALKLRESILILIVITIIMILGIFVLKMPISIILILETVFVSIVSFIKGTSYNEIQNIFISSINGILIPIIIMLLIGALVASWIMSGTVPTLICIGLKAIDEKIFLVISFIICSATSMLIGTSWGTISTLGVAFMGISNALGLPPIYTVSTIVSGAIVGDKMSPLSSSVILASQLTNTNLTNTIKSVSRTNVPAFVISIIAYIVIGFMTAENPSSSVDNIVLLEAISDQFTIGIVSLLPPLILVILIVCRFPTIPAFIVGIFIGVLEAIFLQHQNYINVFEGLLSGYTYGQNPIVNELLNYGGINSMASILTLLIFAASFGGIIKHLGVISSILDRLFKSSAKKVKILTSALLIHAFGFIITGNYYTTNSILAPSFLSLFSKNKINNSNITSIFLDTGTGISPLVPWSPTAIFVANTLGFASIGYCIFSPMLWLPLMIYPIIGIILERRGIKYEKNN